jgi:hypothetical protein
MAMRLLASGATRGRAALLLTPVRQRFFAILSAALVPLVLHADIDVLTNRYDAARTGANLRETALTASNVTVNRFGKLYSHPVKGAVYAQPLHVSGVTINGTSRDVLYVATMEDRVYAFDAASSSPTPLWSRDFTSPPSVTPVPITDLVGPNLNIVGNVGVQGTPVIDKATNSLYLVARTKENGSYVQRLHALDLVTGAEHTGSPVKIAAAVLGNAGDSTVTASGRVITFDPKMHVQRAGLALVNGVVIVSWAAHEDATPSHGWIIGFNSSTLARVGAFAVTPDDYGGGIWQGGRAPAIDAAGNVYIATGNGKWDGTRNYGDSLLKFTVSRSGLALTDYFTPGNESQLSSLDNDLSGSGFTLLPGTNLLIGGGKEGVLYLLNSQQLGHKVSNDTQIVQKIPVGGGHVMGGAVFWASPNAGSLVYNWSENDALTAYRLSGGRLLLPAYAEGQVVSPGHPGGSLTLSANGSTANTGIVWASMPTSQDNLHGLEAGILRAFNAETLAELWTSEQNSGRDRLGTLMKFVPPLVVNGKVFLPNQDGAVAVYGLLPAGFSVSVSPASRVIPPGASGTFSVTVSPVNGFTGSVALSATGQPSGTTVQFSPASLAAGSTATMTVSVPASATSGFAVTVKGTSGTLTQSATPVTVSVTSASARAEPIGIDFVGSGTSVMGTAESAGVVAQTHWNSAAGATRSTPLALMDGSGASSGASTTWSSNGTWATPITEQAGNARMMRGYLDTTSTSTTTVQVEGLTSRTYDVYVYTDGDNKGYARTAGYTISGPGITTTTIQATDAANTNFSSVFTRASNSAGNYVRFTITGSGFAVSAAPIAPDSGSRRAPINGIQIVPVNRASIGIDFVGSNATRMATGETAGVIPRAAWNSAAGAARSTRLSLVDDKGALSGATVTWSAAGNWQTPITDQAGNARMMKGYIDTTTTSTSTVTVAGLARGTYDVYVYVDGDNATYVRTGTYALAVTGGSTTSKTATDPANTNFSSTFTQASNSSGNYVRFSFTGSGFTLSAKGLSGGNTTLRAPVNGIQIVPAATP